MDLLIFAPQPTPRLTYVCHLFFDRLCQLPYRLCFQQSEYAAYEGPKLNYSRQAIAQREVWIPSGSLLFESALDQSTSMAAKKIPVLPTVSRAQTSIRIEEDIWAWSFFLAVRYEEYLPFSPDQFGRFPVQASIAYRDNCLDRPVINEWVHLLTGCLRELFPDLLVRLPRFRFTPTYDIDLAWAFRERSFVRTVAATARDVLKGNWHSFQERRQVLGAKKKDPFFTFPMLDQWHQELQLKPVYFFLLGDNHRLDRNIDPSREAFRKLLESIHAQYQTGIHPSFFSNRSIRQLQKEFDRYQFITGERPLRSRQHYLVLRFPATYRRLIELEIREDYSMGYSARAGYRAGLANPFPWYDLEQERITELMIYPFAFMDVTLMRSWGMQFTPDEALHYCQQQIEHCRRLGGHLISLWHNSSFAPHEGWHGWEKSYRQILEAGVSY